MTIKELIKELREIRIEDREMNVKVILGIDDPLHIRAVRIDKHCDDCEPEFIIEVD